MSSPPRSADTSSQQQRRLPTPRRLLTAVLDAISEIRPDLSSIACSLPNPHPTPAAGLDGSTIATIAAANKTSNTNPLAHIPSSARHLFTTLHVLFPSLLLPALDLLDRGLVTRLAVAVAVDGVARRKQQQTHNHHAPQDQQPRQDKEEKQEQQQPHLQLAEDLSHIYLVRSAQKVSSNPYHYHHHHHHNDASPGLGTGPGQAHSDSHNVHHNQRLYAVHTIVWNCTCAAFAFSAFPAVSNAGDGVHMNIQPTKKQEERKQQQQQQQQPGARSTETSPSRQRQEEFDDIPTDQQTTSIPCCADCRDNHDHDDNDADDEVDLPDSHDFGGLSFNGMEQDGNDAISGTSDASVPPCCKHLLACVLAERCDTILGHYVNRRTVQREEMAGIFADV